MKACIPVSKDRGLESRLYPHFGSAPVFLLVDTETKACRAIDNPAFEREHGRCHPLDLLGDERVDLLVVSGIGAGALDRLTAARVPVHHTTRGTVAEALDAIGKGSLPPVLPEREPAHGFGGGRGRHGHGHGCGPGRGRHGQGHGRGA
jgi:predicted Fe-Mo cluster-binding NifX family protein